MSFARQIIYIVVVLLFFESNSLYANRQNDFSGVWCHEIVRGSGAFSIGIRNKGHFYSGYYISTTQYGNRIEFDPTAEALNFKDTNQAVIITNFKEYDRGTIGLIQLRLLGNNKMKWRVLKYPRGITTVPREAILYKCKDKVPD